MNDDVTSKIRGYIVDELIRGQSVDLTEDTRLLNGLVDSLGLQQLASFIEDEFDVTLDLIDMSPENFGTIRDLDRLVGTKLRGPATPGAAVG